MHKRLPTVVQSAAMADRLVAVVTAPRTPEPWHDFELPMIERALYEREVRFQTVAWYDDVDWSRFALAVLRSPWDLYWHLEEFQAWLKLVASQTTMFNPPATVAWNLDKRYLLELEAGGIPIVPTQIVEPGQEAVIDADEYVVKPTTSAGALNSARYVNSGLDNATSREHIAFLHAHGMGAMIQPYIGEIERSGEHALIFYNGRFDHAIRKGHVMQPGETYKALRDSHPSPIPYAPSAAELELARNALARAPGSDSILHARVDIVSDGQQPLLMELELVDPVLFFATSTDSVARYANAIYQRLYGAAPA